MQDIIAILILRKLSKFCDEYNGMIIKVFRYILVNLINLKVHLISYNIHNTPFQVLNFRPKSTGEPPRILYARRHKENNTTPIPKAQKQRA